MANPRWNDPIPDQDDRRFDWQRWDVTTRTAVPNEATLRSLIDTDAGVRLTDLSPHSFALWLRRRSQMQMDPLEEMRKVHRYLKSIDLGWGLTAVNGVDPNGWIVLSCGAECAFHGSDVVINDRGTLEGHDNKHLVTLTLTIKSAYDSELIADLSWNVADGLTIHYAAPGINKDLKRWQKCGLTQWLGGPENPRQVTAYFSEEEFLPMLHVFLAQQTSLVLSLGRKGESDVG